MSTRAADMQPREQKFLWHGRLPIGHMTVIAGSPRMGKSTLGYRIAADAGVPTLFVTTEEVGETVWLPRLLAAGADPEKAWYHPEVRFTKNPLDIEYLTDLIKEHKIKLIIVDPVQNHLGVSVSHDQAVRDLMEPYMPVLQELKVALLLEAHVLRDISPSSDPLLAVPAGLRGWAKAVYLFGKDPTLGADQDLRILATTKFNFGKDPASRRFEFTTEDVSVTRASGRGQIDASYGKWIDRGEAKVTAKALLVTLSPETKERKLDRVAFELIAFLRKGRDGRMQPAAAVRKMIEGLDPPMVMRTAERAASELGIEKIDDPADARKKWWNLPEDILATYEEATDADDVIEISEIEIPDSLPEDFS
jgi:hypothetical protein